MEQPRMRGVLNTYGRRAIVEMVAILRGADKEASGRLIRSLRHEVVEALDELGLLISMDSHAVYVDAGRKPGLRPPPVDRIREWCRLRGIPEQAAWPIARNIGRFGIEPTPFLFVAERLDQDMEADLELAASRDLEAAIRKDFKELESAEVKETN